jgi:hypothetical protein
MKFTTIYLEENIIETQTHFESTQEINFLNINKN